MFLFKCCSNKQTNRLKLISDSEYESAEELDIHHREEKDARTSAVSESPSSVNVIPEPEVLVNQLSDQQSEVVQQTEIALVDKINEVEPLHKDSNNLENRNEIENSENSVNLDNNSIVELKDTDNSVSLNNHTDIKDTDTGLISNNHTEINTDNSVNLEVKLNSDCQVIETDSKPIENCINNSTELSSNEVNLVQNIDNRLPETVEKVQISKNSEQLIEKENCDIDKLEEIVSDNKNCSEKLENNYCVNANNSESNQELPIQSDDPIPITLDPDSTPIPVRDDLDDVPLPASKGYCLDFLDNLDDPNFNPFASKTAIRNSPPPTPTPGTKLPPLKPTVKKKGKKPSVSKNSNSTEKNEETNEINTNKSEELINTTQNEIKLDDKNIENDSLNEIQIPNSINENNTNFDAENIINETKDKTLDNKENALIEIKFDNDKPCGGPPKRLGKKPQLKNRIANRKKSEPEKAQTPAEFDNKKTDKVNNNNEIVTQDCNKQKEEEEEIPIPKKSYDLSFLDNLDDPNFDPFASKTEVRNSPPKEGFITEADSSVEVKQINKVNAKKSNPKKGFNILKKQVKSKVTKTLENVKSENNNINENNCDKVADVSENACDKLNNFSDSEHNSLPVVETVDNNTNHLTNGSVVDHVDNLSGNELDSKIPCEEINEDVEDYLKEDLPDSSNILETVCAKLSLEECSINSDTRLSNISPPLSPPSDVSTVSNVQLSSELGIDSKSEELKSLPTSEPYSTSDFGEEPTLSIPEVPSVNSISKLDSIEFEELLSNEASRLAEELMNYSTYSTDSGLAELEDSNLNNKSVVDSESDMAESKKFNLEEALNPFKPKTKLLRSPPLHKRMVDGGENEPVIKKHYDTARPKSEILSTGNSSIEQVSRLFIFIFFKIILR